MKKLLKGLLAVQLALYALILVVVFAAKLGVSLSEAQRVREIRAKAGERV